MNEKGKQKTNCLFFFYICSHLSEPYVAVFCCCCCCWWWWCCCCFGSGLSDRRLLHSGSSSRSRSRSRSSRNRTSSSLSALRPRSEPLRLHRHARPAPCRAFRLPHFLLERRGPSPVFGDDHDVLPERSAELAVGGVLAAGYRRLELGVGLFELGGAAEHAVALQLEFREIVAALVIVSAAE